MGSYLELLEKSYEYGLISTAIYNKDKAWYNSEKTEQKTKDRLDKESQKELNLFIEDKSSYLLSKLIKETKSVKNYTDVIKGWVVFFGILFIVNTIILLIPFLA